jgi:Pyruvate/2-oxoacid:ferredoxin oxidoreductase delta subunit
MTIKTIREIVKIDEDKCDGCGLCVPACVEGALQIVDGKAKLISDTYCDGLGACLGECPQDAITIEERGAEEFDEEAASTMSNRHSDTKVTTHTCPSATVTTFTRGDNTSLTPPESKSQPSELDHWPIQLTLVPPKAPFLQGSALLLAADCVPFAYSSFHHDFLKDHTLLIACPKLDDLQTHFDKLTELLRQSDVKSLMVAHMEVPCCSNLASMAKQAAIQAGKPDLPVKYIDVGLNGEIKSEK